MNSGDRNRQITHTFELVQVDLFGNLNLHADVLVFAEKCQGFPSKNDSTSTKPPEREDLSLSDRLNVSEPELANPTDLPLGCDHIKHCVVVERKGILGGHIV